MTAIVVTLTVAVLALAIFVGALFLNRKPPPDYWLRTTGTGKPLKWDRESFPLAVMLAQDLPPAYVCAYREARKLINWQAGAELFGFGTTAGESIHDISDLGDGRVLITVSAVAPMSEPDHGITSCSIDAETGEIRKAVVQLPPDRNAVAKLIVLHDLFHVLGFRDDRSGLTVMHPKLSGRPQKSAMTTEDQRRLRQAFDTSFSRA